MPVKELILAAETEVSVLTADWHLPARIKQVAAKLE
jgi:hypothetical protein